MRRKCLCIGILTCLVIAVARADEASPPANPDVVKDWNGSIALGLNITKGNSDTLLFNAAAAVEKLWKKDEWHFGADGAYGINNWGHTDESKSADNIHGVMDYRHLFTERFYAGASAEFLHDDVADVAYRFILSPFVGYYFIKSPETRLRGEVGPAYIAERVGGDDHQFIALRLSERFERDLSKTSKIWEQVDYFPHVDDFGNYLLNAEIGAEAAMNAQLSLRVVVQDKFNSQPPTGRERNDLTILASLVWKFGANLTAATKAIR